MVKNLKSYLSLLIGLSMITPSAFANNVCPTKDYVIEKTNKNGSFSRKEMYAPMVPGSGSQSASGIVIVDERDYGNQDILASYPELNASLFENHSEGIRGTFDEDLAHRGAFKIAYRYNATECRRQVILGAQNLYSNGDPTGTFNGWTAIEICNLGIKQLFVLGKQALGAGNMPTVDHFLGFVDVIYSQGKLPQALYDQINQNLKPQSHTQRSTVIFFKDADGDILPRFAVELTTFWYEDTGNSCRMMVNHDRDTADYAGLVTSSPTDYTWDLDYNPVVPSQAFIWAWDAAAWAAGNKSEGTPYSYEQVIQEPNKY